MTDFDASAHLKSLEGLPDDDIDLAVTALCLSGAASGPSLEKYVRHIDSLSKAVIKRFEGLVERGGADDARTRLAALKHVLSDEHDYRLDKADHEILESCDLARVIDRRKGAPAAIDILYIEIARRQGWSVCAIDFPTYMLCRIDCGREHIIFDAARQCKILTAADLRERLKQSVGPKAELIAAYYQALSPRQTLTRLQNHIKSRFIEMGEYSIALEVIEQMRLIDPSEYRLLLDAGVLYAKTGKPQPAIRALEGYISKAPKGPNRAEAQSILNEILQSL